MFKNRPRLKLGFVAMMFAMLFTACQSMPMGKNVSVELAPWSGEWVSMASAVNSPDLDSSYAKVAKKMPNYTAEGFKDAVSKMYESDVVRAEITDTNMFKLTIVDRNGNYKTVDCEYRFEGKVPIKGYKDHFWYTFKLVNNSDELKSVSYLIATEPHAHEGGPRHWHARFGGYDIDSLVNEEAVYWPTFVSASKSEKEIVEFLKEEIDEMSGMFPASPFEEYVKYEGVKNGMWINLSTVLQMDTTEINAVYEKIIKNYAGKNPNGGDFTKEELKEMAKKASARMAGAGKFTHIQFIVKNGQNILVVWNNNKKVFESKYNRVGANSYNKNFMAMEAEKMNASFKTILFTEPHFNHLHLVYGNNAEEMEKNAFGTFVPADGTKEMMAGMVEYVLTGSVKRAIKENKTK